MNNTWIIWVIQSGVLLVIGIIGFFVKRTLCQFEKAIEELRDKIRQVEKEHNNFVNQLPYLYTLRDDFIRTVGNFDRKLDRILDKLTGGE